MKRRKRSCLHFLLIILLFLSSCGAQSTDESNLFQLTETIALPGISGRIDHLTFDNKNKIVFVAALGSNTVEAVYLKSKKVFHAIKNLNEPQGLAYIPESNSLIVANGANGELDIFSAATFQKISTIKLGDDADNARYDAVNKKIYVGYAGGGIAVIDATTFKLISQIKLDAHPESFELDQLSKKIYVNVPDAQQIEIIDLTKNIVVDKWKMAEAKANFPMALDESNHRLFIGCRHPSKLLVMDTKTGKTISSIHIDGDADDIFYDVNKENLPDGNQLYVSCGSGYVDVITQSDANNYKLKGKIKSKPGARTSLFIPELSSLIVAAPATRGSNAQLMIYKTK